MSEHETTPTTERRDCDFSPKVSAYYDGELGTSDAREVTVHLANCPDCAARLAFFGKVSRRFESSPPPRLDADARQRLDDLGEEIAAERHRIKPTADVRWVRRLSAAAAILFVIAAGKVIYDQNATHPQPGPGTPALDPSGKIKPADVRVTNYPQPNPSTGQSESH